MYIKRVVLENVKGFAKVDFTFTRDNGSFEGWSVVTGENGTGKTALLKAIALAVVGPEVARALQPSFKGWVREGASNAAIAVEIVPHDVDSFTTGRRYEESFWSEIVFERAGSDVAAAPGDRFRRKKKGPLNGPWAVGTHGWFTAGYGPFRRLYGASTEAQRVMSGPARVARFATMFKEDATLGECERWLIDLAHKRLEKRDLETEILDCVTRLLNDEFLHNGIRVDHVDSDGLWLRDSSGAVLHLADMSEGYRAALAMMIDVIRQLVDVYGANSLLTSRASGFAVPHPGVVLIDEVDAHIHPEWQRRIGFWMKERFPRIQFITTTHSALICQAADSRGMFHMTPPGSGTEPFQLSALDHGRILSSRPDEILLGPAFGLKHTRSPKAVESRARWAQLAAKERSAALSQQERAEKDQLQLFVRDDRPSGGQ